jgi:hypothetical protein
MNTVRFLPISYIRIFQNPYEVLPETSWRSRECAYGILYGFNLYVAGSTAFGAKVVKKVKKDLAV